jgi:hypothetical protein
MVRILVFALVVPCGASFTSSAADAQGPATPFTPGILTQAFHWCGPKFAPVCDEGYVPTCTHTRMCNYFGRRVTECVGWRCTDITGRGLDTFPHGGRRGPGAGRLRSR